MQDVEIPIHHYVMFSERSELTQSLGIDIFHAVNIR